jgi:hypothetical protein
LFLLFASLIANGLQQTTSLGQTVGGSPMVSGVLAHGMTPAEAQTLAASNITWVSCDVTFNGSDISNWQTVYSLAQQYHLSLLGVLDQHLMNYSNTFTLTDWSNAVTQAVVAFGSVVKTWEIWNEPNYYENDLGYFNGTAQAYVSMLQVAYNDIKAIASSDTVIGLGGMPLYTSDNPTLNDTYAMQAYVWAQQVVQLGGISFCDAISVHAYPYGQYYPAIAGALFTSNLQQYNQLCNKPIWVTEIGQESYSTTWAATETQQSTFLAQSYTLFQSLGVKAYIWYELSDNYTAIPNSNFGLFDNNGNQKQAFDTFVKVINGLTFPTASPNATPTASPTQNPTNPTSTTSPIPSPTQSTPATTQSTPTPTATPKPIFEENYVIALIAGLVIAFAVAISVYVKRLGHPKNLNAQ